MTVSAKIRMFLIVCLCSATLMGCKSRDDEASGSSDVETKALITLVKDDLDKTKRELADLKQDMQGFVEVQNEIAEQVKQLVAATGEKAPAPTELAGSDVKDLITQLNQQLQNLSQLENRITQINASVENLRTTVTEQQATINDLLNVVEEESATVEQQDDTGY
jgi:DNA repair exonuclease SbcCD ATPase subunit